MELLVQKPTRTQRLKEKLKRKEKERRTGLAPFH